MNEPKTIPESEFALVAEPDEERSSSSKPRKDPSAFDENDVQMNYVLSSFAGILCAGFAYPSFLGSIVLIANLVKSDSTERVLEGLFTLLVICLSGGFLALLTCALTGLLSIALVIVMNRSLGNPLDARSAAISAGSMACYAPTVWILFIPGMDLSRITTIGFLGPILAMTLGAIGAAWASATFSGYDFSIAKQKNRSKLSIMQLMTVTTLIAITFAIANLFGGLEFAIAAAGWFVLQAIMLGIINAHQGLRKLR